MTDPDAAFLELERWIVHEPAERAPAYKGSRITSVAATFAVTTIALFLLLAWLFAVWLFLLPWLFG